MAQTYGDGLDDPGDSLSASGIEDAAISFVEKELGNIEHTGIGYTSGYRIGNMTYAYVQQTLEDVRHMHSFIPGDIHAPERYILNANSNSISITTVCFDGNQDGSLYLDGNTDEKSITWGPFDAQMTIKFTFYYLTDGSGWYISTIKDDKVKEVRDFSF